MGQLHVHLLQFYEHMLTPVYFIAKITPIVYLFNPFISICSILLYFAPLNKGLSLNSSLEIFYCGPKTSAIVGFESEKMSYISEIHLKTVADYVKQTKNTNIDITENVLLQQVKGANLFETIIQMEHTWQKHSFNVLSMRGY